MKQQQNDMTYGQVLAVRILTAKDLGFEHIGFTEEAIKHIGGKKIPRVLMGNFEKEAVRAVEFIQSAGLQEQAEEAANKFIPVSYDKAKHLEELGFDLPTDYCYHINTKKLDHSGLDVPVHWNNPNQHWFYISAPTIEQAEKWECENTIKVVDNLNQKQNTAMEQKQLRRQILGVPLTPELAVKYDNGDAIYLENMRNSKSEVFNSFVYKDENGKMKFSKHDPKELEQAKERRRSFGGVPFTPTQVLNYEKGTTIFLEGVQKDGESIKRDVFVTKLPNNEIKVVEKKPSIDISEVKQIPIKGFLSQHGFEPQEVKKGGAELWYNSPLREEKTPSFRVDTRKNTFKDFGGEGHGGSVIDLAMVMYGTDLKGAMTALSEQVGMHTPVKKFFTLKNEVEPPQKKTTITKVDELKHPALLQYLDERCIDIEVARKFCKEIHYKNEDSNKEYFAIGFQNDSGDWELRNKYYKGCTGKNISVVKSTNSPSSVVSVFEGFTDALSFLSELKENANASIIVPTDIIVLNSVALANEKNASLVERLEQYDNVFTYLDNDESGRQANERLAKICKEKNLEFFDHSSVYSKFNDYNEFRVASQRDKNNQQKPSAPTQRVSPSRPKLKRNVT